MAGDPSFHDLFQAAEKEGEPALRALLANVTNLLSSSSSSSSAPIPHDRADQRYAPLSQQEEPGPADMPALPQECHYEEPDEVCPLLDELEAFLRTWATRSYAGYHEAVALWVMSVIAARRCFIPWRTGIYPALYIVLVSRSSAYAKTEVAQLGMKILEDTGLGFLATGSETTPQRLVSLMGGRWLPADFDRLPAAQQQFEMNRLAFAAQRGWFYDEFGDKLREVFRGTSHQNYFYRLLKQLYDVPGTYRYETIARQAEIIERPYLALLGTAQPAGLASLARADHPAWTDGFLSRFAWIVSQARPPSFDLQNAPLGLCQVPASLMNHILSWHERLGIPQAELIPVGGEEAETPRRGRRGRRQEPLYEIHRIPVEPTSVALSGEVYQAHLQYTRALTLLSSDIDERAMGTYGRLPDMTLRLALLLASANGETCLTLLHWSKAQAIAERWRQSFHELLRQLSQVEPHSLASERSLAEALRECLVRLHSIRGLSWVRIRDIQQYGQTAWLRNARAETLRSVLQEMEHAGEVVSEGTGTRRRYQLTFRSESAASSYSSDSDLNLTGALAYVPQSSSH